VSERSTPPDGGPDAPGTGPRDDQHQAKKGVADETPYIKVVDRRWWARDVAEHNEVTQSDKPTYIEGLEARLADKDTLLAEYAARYKAASNDFEETRIRLRKEVVKDVDRTKRQVLTSFLEVIDNLDRAIDTSQNASDNTPGMVRLLKGVKMVQQQFLLTLNSYGVERINAGGAPFDPNLHDAISVAPVTNTAHENIVVDVVKPGYQLGDEVLRPATVTVGKLAPVSE